MQSQNLQVKLGIFLPGKQPYYNYEVKKQLMRANYISMHLIDQAKVSYYC